MTDLEGDFGMRRHFGTALEREHEGAERRWDLAVWLLAEARWWAVVTAVTPYRVGPFPWETT